MTRTSQMRKIHWLVRTFLERVSALVQTFLHDNSAHFVCSGGLGHRRVVYLKLGPIRETQPRNFNCLNWIWRIVCGIFWCVRREMSGWWRHGLFCFATRLTLRRNYILFPLRTQAKQLPSNWRFLIRIVAGHIFWFSLRTPVELLISFWTLIVASFSFIRTG